MKDLIARRRLALALPLSAAATVLPACAQETTPSRSPDVPYVPTPPAVVRRMLVMANVTRRDTVYDLGCGDGRIVIAAARERGARGVGIDIDPLRIDEARLAARKADVQDRVRFEVADLFESDFSPASVVTLYLLPSVNLRLRPQLWRQLAVGTRVVSHAFDMGEDWPPDETVEEANRTVYFWRITQAHKAALR
jgi:SAM-dependent methyltransferase